MDRSTWSVLRPLIRQAVQAIGPSPRVRFSDELILSMYIWAVAHDRPLSWASQRQNYGFFFRPRVLPSNSQFCRRVASPRLQSFLQHLHHATAGREGLGQLNFFDGKPLGVGNYTRDPDAKVGWGAGRVDKGYKLHAVVTADRRIPSWSVMPLSQHEMAVAGTMVEQAPAVPPGSVFMADGNYDAAQLHKVVAHRGGRLFVKPRGFAKHPVTLRQMGQARRELLDLWQRYPQQAEQAYHQRIHVEGTFSNLTSFGGGLGPLPSFVRRLSRVRRWVGVKILLYHLRLSQRRAQAA